MRILVLTDFYPPHFIGGYELNCKEQMEGLTDRGHDVFVLTSCWGVAQGEVTGNVYRLLHLDPISFGSDRRENALDPLRLRRRYRQLKWAFACRRNYNITRETAASLNPDIVYVWRVGEVSINPVLAAQDQGIPIVFNLEDYWLAELKSELCQEPSLLKRRYRAAIVGLTDFNRINLCHILVISRALMRSYVEIGFAEQSFTVIPPGVPAPLILSDGDLPRLTRSNADGVRLIFVGRLVPEKGPDIAIAALAHLVEEVDIRHVLLDIVGAGPDEYVRQLHNMVRVRGLEKNVQFCGRLEHGQVFSHYAQYDALLFTSRWEEPFGVTILEAMARGLPVIAADTGAVPEIISDGENGLLVPPDEPMMLANAVMRLMQDSALRQSIRQRALNTVRERYTNECIIDRVEGYLQMVARQSQRGFVV